MKVKTYLGECSVGDWFVLYQMSKNMNKRLFFDFFTSLSQRTRKEALQDQFATQVTTSRAVNAFKRSLKKSTKDKEKKEDGEKEEPVTNPVLVSLTKSPLTCSQPQAPNGCEERLRRSGEDDVDYEDEQRL